MNILDMKKIVPDPSMSIYNGGIVVLEKYKKSLIFWQIEALYEKHGVTIKTPIKEIPEEAMDEIMNGTEERIYIRNESMGNSGYLYAYEGVVKYILMQQDDKDRKSTRRTPVTRESRMPSSA